MMNRSHSAIVIVLLLAACASPDADETAADAADDGPLPAASVPTTINPGEFTVVDGMQTWDARRAMDLTGDGKPETIVLHASGPRIDTADVRLSILNTNADTLYAAGWNTSGYFQYTYRSTFTDFAANAKVIAHLQRVLNDSAFTAHDPTTPPAANSTNIDRDAIRYDLKEHAVRTRHNLPQATPLQGAMFDELEKAPVTDAAIDSLATELAMMPTFTYFAGGEVTNRIAWSNARQRFTRIFSCC